MQKLILRNPLGLPIIYIVLAAFLAGPLAGQRHFSGSFPSHLSPQSVFLLGSEPSDLISELNTASSSQNAPEFERSSSLQLNMSSLAAIPGLAVILEDSTFLIIAIALIALFMAKPVYTLINKKINDLDYRDPAIRRSIKISKIVKLLEAKITELIDMGGIGLDYELELNKIIGRFGKTEKIRKYLWGLFDQVLEEIEHPLDDTGTYRDSDSVILKKKAEMREKKRENLVALIEDSKRLGLRIPDGLKAVLINYDIDTTGVEFFILPGSDSGRIPVETSL